ncbi:aldo/keto reductase [Actinomyces lilanjuaniae]|uniref:Aldo/keto reductase n=1 Tax=Actinomyces lilanjuaniae TaxID=2321394 RepID=A0ABM6Z1W2_9ACTO|nr:aldo/keto reductase [Actinomyces lilanjuaniae]AYD89117.1 aldo/keto reductase [Actinomyces lilanjuaniae]
MTTTVPTTTLNNGVEMPVLGYGVFQTPPEETERCVREALEVGYRLIDTAQAYANEEGVGAAVARSGVPREEVFLTSKIWVSSMSYERARASIEESLERLGTGYIDLMLLHQAMGDYPGAYRAMEEAYKAGRLRAIGVSNFYPERLVDVAALAEVVPAVNQVETHPFRQADDAHAVMAELGVVHEAWAPFAEGRNNIFTNPVLTEIGKRYGKKPGQVALRALIQKDVVVIPKSTHRDRMEENFDVLDFELTEADLEAFSALDDGSFPRIFDHYDPKVVGWLLRDYVRKDQLGGEALY